MSTPSTLDTPRPVAMMRDQLFEFIVERTDLAASYARSPSEAARRGDQLTVGVHLKQLRLATIAALQTFRELGPEADA